MSWWEVLLYGYGMIFLIIGLCTIPMAIFLLKYIFDPND